MCNNGFCGNNCWWIILLILFCGCGNNGLGTSNNGCNCGCNNSCNNGCNCGMVGGITGGNGSCGCQNGIVGGIGDSCTETLFIIIAILLLLLALFCTN